MPRIAVGGGTATRVLAFLLLGVLVGALPPAPVDAQWFGFEIGPLWSDIDWSKAPSPGTTVVDDRTALYGGLTGRFPVANWGSLATGVSLLPKGGEYDGVVFRASLLEVPAVFALQTGTSTALFLEAGVALGVRVTCSRSLRVSTGTHTNSCDSETIVEPPPNDDVTLRQIRRWEANWRVALGGRAPVGSGLVVLGIRAERAITDLYPENSQSMRSRGLALVLGYELSR